MLSRRIISLIILMLVNIFFYGCQKVPDSVISTTLYTADSVTKVLSNPKMKNIDTIRTILKRDLHKMDKSAEFLYHYKLEKLYREESNFKESVQQHRIAQRIALDLKDTIFIVRASNQMGTDFRRIGALADAARMHLHALKIASSYSKKDSRIGKRLLSFSLNGVGNVYKSLGNGKEAFSFFKCSAGYDEELKNYIGLAVNHVTMGSILEQQGRADSAYIYYQRAMHYDSLMNSKKGIAICHNRMGKLFSKTGEMGKSTLSLS